MTTSNCTITKKYTDFPAGHRQSKHDGHCKYLHGHDWAFEFEFYAAKRDENNFIVDFGKLKFIKDWLTHWFDHTFLVGHDDPSLDWFKKQDAEGVIQLRILPSVSCEGIAEFVFQRIQRELKEAGHLEVMLMRVQVWEDSKNTAIARS